RGVQQPAAGHPRVGADRIDEQLHTTGAHGLSSGRDGRRHHHLIGAGRASSAGHGVRKHIAPRGRGGLDSSVLDSRPAAAAASPTPAAPAAPGVLRSILRNHRRSLAIILPLGTISEVVELLMPIMLGLIIDRGIVAGDLRLTVLGALGLILMRVLGVLLWTWTFLLSQRAVMFERHRLRVGL